MTTSTPHGIRFTTAEWRRITAAAQRIGVPPATLVRSAALAATGEVGLPGAIAAELARTLGEWIERLLEG